MLLDILAGARLRSEKAPVDLIAALAPVVEAVRDDTVDLSRLRVSCDWVQYRGNFREAVDTRSIHPDTACRDRNTAVELAVDLRRCSDPERVREQTARVLREYAGTSQPDRVYLEDWTPATDSTIWRFNSLYWRELGVWEEATGRRYEQALPGGESDARNVASVGELIGAMFAVWDNLAGKDALPKELYVVELGVGNGNQARTWLDEFARLDEEHGRNYYQRLHYLMCDYSEHVLRRARENVSAHAGHVSSFVLDATTPATALGFLRYKVFLVYVSNVYDNLPTEELARIGNQIYRVQVRAYVAGDDARRIATSYGLDVSALTGIVDKLLRLGPGLLCDAVPDCFGDEKHAAAFWQEMWTALRLAERYAPLAGLDMYEVAPGISGELLRPFLEDDGDIRMQVGNGAVASFAETLRILHPYGRLTCHDIFVQDVAQYRSGFRGPGKYDGSIVNWVNGCVLEHVGTRAGFDVRFERFAHRTGTNIVTLTAQARD